MSKALRVHYFQHIEGEGFGSCLSYFQQRQAEITATTFFDLPPQTELALEALPAIEDVDLLMIMGGVMSVNDHEVYPWLTKEIEWIQQYLATGKPVIGLCLGGQLIAKALGSEIHKNPEKERGWHKIYKVADLDTQTVWQIPEQVQVLEWHSETFELPQGAILLAGNTACPHQIYQYKQQAIGFQCHPEMTAKTLNMLFEKLSDEVAQYHGQYVQAPAETLAVPEHTYIEGNLLLEQAIEYVLSHARHLPKYTALVVVFLLFERSARNLWVERVVVTVAKVDQVLKPRVAAEHLHGFSGYLKVVDSVGQGRGIVIS